MSGGAESPVVGTFPVPEGAREVVVFGGSFDPPTRAHTALPIASRDALGADHLVYVPAARSPFKADPPRASGGERVEMLRRALRGEGGVSIATIELERGDAGEASYTVDTLRAVRKRVGGGVRLRLLIGADQAKSFHRWREAGEIVRLAEPAVMLRGTDAEGLLAEMRGNWEESEMERWRERLLDVEPMEGAATDVRALLGEDAGSEVLSRLLDPAVLSYIRERGLYGA